VLDQIPFYASDRKTEPCRIDHIVTNDFDRLIADKTKVACTLHTTYILISKRLRYRGKFWHI